MLNIPKEVKITRFDKPLSQEGLTDLWLSDVNLKGYIKGFFDQESSPEFVIYEDSTMEYNVERVIYKGKKNEQTKVEKKKYSVFKGVKYTPDRTILWEDKSKGIFFKTFDDIRNGRNLDCYFIANEVKREDGSIIYVSYIDTKAPPSPKIQNCSDVSFRIKSKWLYEKYGIYVNKVYNMPTGKFSSPKKYLFLHTFTPYRYFFTDTGQSLRGINKWKAVSIDEFIQKQDK